MTRVLHNQVKKEASLRLCSSLESGLLIYAFEDRIPIYILHFGIQRASVLQHRRESFSQLLSPFHCKRRFSQSERGRP